MKRTLVATLALTAFPLVAARPASLLAQDPFSAEALAELPKDGWRTNGGNLFNQRYSPLFQINRENVGELMYEILDGGGDKPDNVLQEIWVRHAAIAS